MQDDYTNIYQTARRRAGWTQEQAAEVLGLSVESVKAYETDVRVPPAATVAAMAEAYDSPGLRLEHARRTDRLGIIPDAARPRSFPLAVVNVFNRFMNFAEKHRGQELLRIAEDGVIDDEERPRYNEIVAEIEDLTAALLSLMYCDAGAKKERPDVGASKRSGGKRFGEPLDHVSILPKTLEMSRKIITGKAVSLT